MRRDPWFCVTAGRVRIRPISGLAGLAIIAGLANTLCATVAEAISFSSPLVYQEDFVGETAFPTAPEIDVMSGGGLIPTPFSLSPPTLNGSSAHLSVIPTDLRDGIFADIDDEQYSTAESSVGMRGEYSGLTATSPGEAWIVQAFRFTRDDDLTLGGTSVAIILQLTHFTGFSAAQFLIAEERIGPNFVPDYLESQSIPLPLATAALLFAGSPFSLDLEVDPNTATAVASIQVGNDPEISSSVLPLVYAQDYSLSSARQYLEHRGLGDTFELELDSFALYADPQAFVPLFNIDVGRFWGAPSNTYAAAGSPGFWNTVVIGPNSLSDVNGLANGASAELNATSLGQIEATGGETRDLLADWAADASGWSVAFSNLEQDGAYRVRFYTMGLGFAESGMLLANGEPHESLFGVAVPSLVEGESYARIDTLVTGGQLTLTSSPTIAGVPPDTHLAGLQIETTVPLPEPGFAAGLGIALVGFCAGARRRRFA